MASLIASTDDSLALVIYSGALHKHRMFCTGILYLCQYEASISQGEPTASFVRYQNGLNIQDLTPQFVWDDYPGSIEEASIFC